MALAAATPVPLPATSPARLKATVATLVGFGTRHTAVDARPIPNAASARRAAGPRANSTGSARNAAAASGSNGSARRFTGPRAPDGVVVEDVLGIQPGRDPNRVVIVGGHIDSRVTDVMDFDQRRARRQRRCLGRRAGAGGRARCCRSARSTRRSSTSPFPARNRGCGAATLLADTAKARGWQVGAMLNNDIVGNSIGQGGVRDRRPRPRVFRRHPRVAKTWPQQHDAAAAKAARTTAPAARWPRRSTASPTRLPGKFDVVRRPPARPLRPRRRPRTVPETRLSRGALLGRRGKLGRAASGPAHREGRRLWRHDRPDGLRLSGEGHRDQRRDDRPARDRARGPGGRDAGRRPVARHDGGLGGGARRGGLPRPLAAQRRHDGLDRRARRDGDDRPC